MARRIDLRPQLGPVRSQGQRPTCLAFAASAVHEAALFDEHETVDTSEEYLYWASKQHDASTDPGTTFPAVRDGFATNGQPLEEQWPYDETRNDQDGTYSPPPAAHTAQPRWSPKFSRVSPTPKSVKAELDAGRAVVLGIPTWPDLDVPAAGRLAVPAPEDLDGAFHAVAVVGYDELTAEMIIRNSWGPLWGENGTAWLPFRFVAEHACETWVVGPAGAVSAAPVTSTSSARYGSVEGAPQ